MLKKLLNIKTIIFVLLTVAFILTAPKIIGLLLMLFASFVLAAALNPFVNKLESKFKNRSLAAIVSLLIVFVLIIVLILPIIIMGVKEVEVVATILPEKLLKFYQSAVNFCIYGHSLSDIIPTENIINASPDVAQGLFNHLSNITLGFFQMCFFGIMLTMFVFYIIVDKHYLKSKFIEFFPPHFKSKAESILYDITSKVGNYIRAQILSMFAVGLMITISVAILGIDYPVLLGLIAGICDIIPILGPSIALAVIIMVAYPLGIVKIILAIILFLTAQQLSNYVIRPFLFGKFMKLHPITILVALVVAQEFLGIWGVILSPAIAATVCVLFDELYLNPINEKEQDNGVEQ
ncbi:AI-2E family transporter [bacterium]|nr:AI-2E family transporter [bacterium]